MILTLMPNYALSISRLEAVYLSSFGTPDPNPAHLSPETYTAAQSRTQTLGTPNKEPAHPHGDTSSSAAGTVCKLFVLFSSQVADLRRTRNWDQPAVGLDQKLAAMRHP